ncbi:MAG: MFS transporter [Gammaproteobacteria bacterium]|nr:MFS transporter [Gammaproteobacteria bacterium]
MDTNNIITEDNLPISLPRAKGSDHARKRTKLLAWSIFITGVLYYCFAYLLRVYPSVMEHQLRSYFHITAGGFGLLTAFYYFAYAPMQLPVGVSVDRIGPRRSLIFACSISTLGVLLFAISQHFGLALIGRFMVGFGAAFAYVTALKLASVWLPRKFFATATGLVTGSGMVSAIFTYNYLTHSVQIHGFKHAVLFPLYFGMILFIMILCLVRNKPEDSTAATAHEKHAVTYYELLTNLKLIIKSRQMWIIGIVGFLLYLPSSVFLDVWAIPYLHYAHGMTPAQAAFGVSLMLGGWIGSSFLSCALSDIFGTRRTPLVIASFTATVVAMLVLYAHLPVTLLYACLFLFGLCCGPHPLCFTLSKENNDHKVSGTAISFANFIIMMGGFIFQPVVGSILDLLWDGKLEHGIRYYSSFDYNIALSILPIGLCIAALLTLFIKETYNNAH